MIKDPVERNRRGTERALKSYYAKASDPEFKKLRSERTRQWRLKNPEKRAAYVKGAGKRLGFERDLRIKYGITLEDYARLVHEQDRKCAICKDFLLLDGKTHLDHCHATGTVRGVLCWSCNTALGHFKDSEEVLESALNYKKRFTRK